MLHEAVVQHSIYSPDTVSRRVSFPIFVPSYTGRVVTSNPSSPAVGKLSQIDNFINNIATPIQSPLLPAPDVKAWKPSRAKRYKKPLSPASLKTIADLVEKGGCKTIRLKTLKKKVAIAPL
ncbi:uncharacterized protein LOC127783027 [Oryza glaberrima]|uniref:uncharacterized protein LOC127783027 n=1 Tax=Oryza glaberrima TaxID=4538 RepID=UPI00224C2EC1|nr:uncharacterized protein LOC127783027 [Oryza glaberrima]